MNELAQTKLTRELVGIENDNKHFVMNGQSANDLLKNEVINKHNDLVDQYVDELNSRNERLNDYAKMVADNMDDLEIMPIGSNIIMRPFSENPFQKIQRSDSGVIVDLGGAAPKYKSHETGEIEEEESFIKVAVVVCVGPEVKYIKEGDTVMYTKPSAVPLPFFRQGFEMTNEGRISAVINSGLSERFNNIK